MNVGQVRVTLAIVAAAALSIAFASKAARAGEPRIHTFDRRQLTDIYFSEGAAVADLNRDGHVDAIYGPYWYAGPSFEKRHEIYPPKPQPTDRYADNFFTWAYDFTGDGWLDLLVVGLPNTPAFVFVNPADRDGHWEKHGVFEAVGNESPAFVDLLGNKKPVIVCTTKGGYGWVTPNWEHPLEKWAFHRVSEQSMRERNPHGLGIGDLNGDGRNDILIATGWFEQPEAKADSTTWKFHEVPFTNAYGGAEMYVYDVNGDGRNDVITSLAAHDFGLAWFEQDRVRGEVVFRQHTIVGKTPQENPFGLVFSELHSVALADIDGDGLKDIITGKTYWSHHKQSPMWDAGAVVYWFRLTRTKDGRVEWTPYLADGEAGVGRQIRIEDVNADKLPDIVVGGMKGGYVLTHKQTSVDESAWRAAQPRRINPTYEPLRRGPDAAIDATSGRVEGALEGESLKVLGTPPGKTSIQDMAAFRPDRWSGGKQLFWSGAKPGDRLDLELTVAAAGEYDVKAVFTMARDYAIVQPLLDGERLGEPLDLFNFPDVLTTGVLTLGRRQLAGGQHRLTLEIKAANPSATAAHMVGLDCLQLIAAGNAK